MKERKVALIDMDGTICDYHNQIKEDLELLSSPEEKISMSDLTDESKPWIEERIRVIKNQRGWWSGLKPIEAGMTVLNLLKAMDFEIEILTKGPKYNRHAWQEKGEWIDRHVGDSVPLNIVGKNKSRYYGDVLVEDYPEYLLGWLEHRPRGLGILIDNEYNANFEHPNVIRTDGRDLEKLVKYFNAVKNREPGKHWKDCL